MLKHFGQTKSNEKSAFYPHGIGKAFVKVDYVDKNLLSVVLMFIFWQLLNPYFVEP